VLVAVSEDLLVKVQIDTSSGTVAVKDLAVSFGDLEKAAGKGGAADALSESEKSMLKAAVAATGLNAALELAKKAYELISEPIKEMVHEAVEGQKAQDDLKKALIGTGQFTKAIVQDLDDFAKSMSLVSTVSETEVTAMEAMAKGIGLSNVQTKELLEASRGLAAFTQRDMQSTFQELLGTYNGVTGRIGKYVDGVDQLTESQIRLGGVVDLATKKFKGLGEATSIAAKEKQLAIAFSQLKEEIGATILESIKYDEILDKLKKIFIDLREGVKQASEKFREVKQVLASIPWSGVAKAILEIVAAMALLKAALNIGVIVTSVSSAISTLGAIKLTGLIASIVEVGASIVALVPTIATFGLIAAAVLGIAVAIDFVIANFDRLKEAASKIATLIKISFVLLGRDMAEIFSLMAVASLKAFSSFLSPFKGISKSIDEVKKKSDELIEGLEKGISTSQKSSEPLARQLSKTSDEISELFKKMKMGEGLKSTLDTVDKLRDSFSGVKKEAESVNKLSEEAAKYSLADQRAKKAGKEELALQAQLYQELLGLKDQLRAYNQTEVQNLRDQQDATERAYKLKKEQLQRDGKLSKDNAGAIVKILNDQLLITREITKEKIKAASYKELSFIVQIEQELLTLKEQLSAMGKSEIEVLMQQQETAERGYKLRLYQYREEGKLRGDNEDYILEKLEKQFRVQNMITREKIKASAVKEAGAAGPLVSHIVGATQVMVDVIEEMLPKATLDSIGPVFADKYKTVVVAATSSFLVDLVKTFTSIRGFMEGSFKFVGSMLQGVIGGFYVLGKFLWDTFGDAAKNFGSSIISAFSAVGKNFLGWVSIGSSFLSGAFDKLISGVSVVGRKLGEKGFNKEAKSLGNWIYEKFSDGSEALKKAGGEVSDKLKKAGDYLWANASIPFANFLRDVGGAILAAFVGAGEWIKNSFREIWRGGSEAFKSISNFFSGDVSNSLISSAGKAATAIGHGFRTVAISLGGVLSGAGDALKSVGGSLYDSISSVFKKGAEYFLKAGEAVGGVFVVGAIFVGKVIAKSFKQSEGTLSEIFGKIGSMIGSVLEGLVSVFSTLMNPKLLVDVANTINQVFEKLPDELNKIPAFLANVINKLPELFNNFLSGLVNAADAIFSALGKIFDQLPEMVSKFMDAFGAIFDKLLGNLDGWINKLIDAFIVFLNKIPEITGKLFKALPGLINTILSRLPEVLTSFFSAVGQILTQLIKAIPGVVVAILDNLPAILQSLIEGVLSVIGTLIEAILDFIFNGGLEKVIKAILRAIPRIVMAILNGLANGLKNIFKSLFGGINIKGFTNVIEGVPAKFEDGIKKLSKAVSKETSKVFKVLDLEAEKRASERIIKTRKEVSPGTEGTTTTGEGEQTKGSLNFFQQFLAGLRDVWLWIYDNIILKLLDGLTGIWNWVYGLLSGLFKGVGEMLNIFWMKFVMPLITNLKNVWDSIIQNLNAAWTVITVLWDATIGAMWKNSGFAEGLQAFGDGLSETLKSVRDSLGMLLTDIGNELTRFFSNIGSFFSSVGNFFTGIGKMLQGALSMDMDKFTKGLSQAFGAAGEKFGDILKQFFRPIVNALNDAKIPKIDVSFKILGRQVDFNFLPETRLFPLIPAFAEGGIVPGTGNSDSILSALTPGEYVINKDAVKSLGTGLLSRLNAGASMPQNTVINIDLGGIKIEASSQSLDENYVRSKLIPAVKDEFKKASLRGDFLLSDRGLRTT
jgi:phage-related protein